MSHSKLAPSSAYQWLKCPGSVVLKRKMPSSSLSSKTEYDNATKGTFLHDVAQYAFKKFDIPKNSDTLFKHNTVRRYIDSFNHELNEEDVDIAVNYVMLYVNAVYKLYKKLKDEEDECIMYIEKRVDVVSNTCYGTADCILFNGKTLVVVDFKTGQVNQHIEAVSSKDNPQLACYLIGAFNLFEEYKLPVKFEGVIVQPTNDNPVTKSEYLYKDLIKLKFKIESSSRIIKNYEALIDKTTIISKYEMLKHFDDYTVFNIGMHCRYCDALPICPKAKEVFFECVSELDKKDNQDMDEFKMAQLIRFKTIFNALIKKTEEFAITLLSCGFNIKGLELTEKRSIRKWKNEEQLINDIPEDKRDSCYNITLKSPTQMSQILDADFINQHCYKPSAGLTVRAKKSEK